MTDDPAALVEENARLECRIQELEAELAEAIETQEEAIAQAEQLGAQLIAARDEVRSANLALAQERAKNKRRGW